MAKAGGAPGQTRKPAGAVGIREFSQLMRQTGLAAKSVAPSGIAVAVSGGADSMALVLLLARWAAKADVPLHALTVDHGLRKGSLAEARKVGRFLKARNIRHHVLRWQGGKPETNIQAAAREARYDLMLSWCSKKDIGDLFLAHHQDDQAETVLLRLIRGSGVDGLSAMSPVVERDGVRLVRPLLQVPADRLKATCRKFGQEWIEDPSNQNPAFDRVIVRNMLDGLKPLGLDAGRLARTADHLSRARRALDQATDDQADSLVEWDEFGQVTLDRKAFRKLPDEIALRLLNRCLMSAGSGDWPPRFERLERLWTALRQSSPEGRVTLAGCLVMPDTDTVRFVRENRNLPIVSITGSAEFLWDNRFKVIPKGLRKGSGQDLTIGPLGANGWQYLKDQKAREAIREELVSLPVAARQTLPALWSKETLIAFPWADFGQKSGTITLSATFCSRIRP